MHTESAEQSSMYAHSALQRMTKEGIPANPENFAVWYEYYSGRNAELVRAIDILVSNNQAFDQALNDDLYDRFIGSTAERQAVKEIGERIQASLEAVIGALQDATEGAGQYGERLRDASETLDGRDIGLDGLKTVIEALVSDTQKVAEQNRRLDKRLRNSSEQVQHMRQELEVAQREALTDGLTGIPNRKFFDLHLRRAVMETMEAGRPLSLLMLDIDFFKRFNDEHGHQVGDEVLKLVARVLQSSIKGQDIAARYGGEEFSIILPDTSLDNAVTVGEHVRKSMASRQVVRRNSGTTYGNITLSIGAAEYAMGEALNTLIARADAALYEAKNGGRNKVVAASPQEVAAAG